MFWTLSFAHVAEVVGGGTRVERLTHPSTVQELLAILREHNGGKASPMLRFMLRFTLWLSFDPFAWQVARLRGLALDMGQGLTPSCIRAQSTHLYTLHRKPADHSLSDTSGSFDRYGSN